MVMQDSGLLQQGCDITGNHSRSDLPFLTKKTVLVVNFFTPFKQESCALPNIQACIIPKKILNLMFRLLLRHVGNLFLLIFYYVVFEYYCKL